MYRKGQTVSIVVIEHGVLCGIRGDAAVTAHQWAALYENLDAGAFGQTVGKQSFLPNIVPITFFQQYGRSPCPYVS